MHIPLAIHPRLQKDFFDCLLQALMKRKRSLADSVLWPPESDDNEVKALYDAILGAEDVEAETSEFEDLKLFDYPELSVQEIDSNTIRVRPTKGGASVFVSTDAFQARRANLGDGDAAAILLTIAEQLSVAENAPLSILGGTEL
ncbi:MAG: hypothetical protein ABJQ53_07485 [Roseibium sp.]